MKTTGNKIPAPTFDAEGYQTKLSHLNGEPLPNLSQVTTRRGGFRAGAGRKTSGNHPLVLRLSPRTAEALRNHARHTGLTMSAIAEEKLSSLR